MLKDTILQIIGTYQTNTDPSGNIINSIAGIDWAWIFAAIAFLIVLLSLFKFASYIFKR